VNITVGKKSVRLILALGIVLSGCKDKSNNDPVYPTDCGNYLVGTYSGSDYCASTGQNYYTCNIQAATTTNITLSSLGGVPVTGIVNCNDNTIEIPTQTVGTSSISGSGKYTANRIVINWSAITQGVPVNCSTTFTR